MLLKEKFNVISQLPQKQEAQYVTQGQVEASCQAGGRKKWEKVEISLYWGLHGKVKARQGKEFRIG